MNSPYQPNANLDLSFQRVIDVPRSRIWQAWTDPTLIKPWFCPRPWKTIDCEIDLRPGGIFKTIMQSPEGTEFPNVSCYLEIVPNTKLIWTNALLPGFRPRVFETAWGPDSAEFLFTAMIELADKDQGTQYTATVIHADEAGRKKHSEMGFEKGWGIALDQLVEIIKQKNVSF